MESNQETRLHLAIIFLASVPNKWSDSAGILVDISGCLLEDHPGSSSNDQLDLDLSSTPQLI